MYFFTVQGALGPQATLFISLIHSTLDSLGLYTCTMLVDSSNHRSMIFAGFFVGPSIPPIPLAWMQNPRVPAVTHRGCSRGIELAGIGRILVSLPTYLGAVHVVNLARVFVTSFEEMSRVLTQVDSR